MTILNLQSENSKEYLLATQHEGRFMIGVGESETEGYAVVIGKESVRQLVSILTEFLNFESLLGKTVTVKAVDHYDFQYGQEVTGIVTLEDDGGNREWVGIQTDEGHRHFCLDGSDPGWNAVLVEVK